METKEKVNNGGANGAVVKGINPVTEENKTQKFVAGNPVNKDSAKPAEPVKEIPKNEPAKPVEPVKAAPVAEAAKPAEPVQAGTKKVELNLEGTLKLVEELHRRKIYRDKLILEIDNLEGFEVDLKEDDEDGDVTRNFFQGCELTLKDSKGRVFSTKNATVIWTTAQMIANLFVNKLAEIEAGITLPA